MGCGRIGSGNQPHSVNLATGFTEILNGRIRFLMTHTGCRAKDSVVVQFRSQIMSIATVVMGVLLSPIGKCGDIAEVFGAEVFDVPWASALSDVRELHPNGNVKHQSGSTKYVVADGRTILGMQRRSNDNLTFSFDEEGRLDAIAVDFRYSVERFVVLLNRMSTLFGPYEAVPNENGAKIVRWPDDEGFLLYLVYVPGIIGSGNFTLKVKNRNLPTQSLSKEELGF